MTALATGRARSVGGGQRSWRTVLYSPSGRYSLYRIRFKEDCDGQWVWTSRTASSEDEARRIFAAVENALDGFTSPPATTTVSKGRTGDALADLYLADSRARGKAVRTVEQRESKLRSHIRPILGPVPVAQWRLTHSRKVIAGAQARGVRSTAVLADIRQDLAAMRKLAWREGWLSRDVDPLDGLALPRRQELHGAGRGFVPPELRPERRQVDAMAATADRLCADGPEPLRRLPLFGTQIRLGGYGGLRMGEQLGLRAIDVFFERGVVHINGSWTQPRTLDAPPFRGAVKNGMLHEAPLPGSLLEKLRPRCAELLGLPSNAGDQEIVRAQTGERVRRGKLAGSPDRWWEAGVDPADELWIFIDTYTGLPCRTELLNERWHRIRRALDRDDANAAWPKYIPYKNLRHHAAGFWHDELGRDWADVAAWLGDTLTTVLNHYVRSGAEALSNAARQLERW
jgi:integrase